MNFEYQVQGTEAYIAAVIDADDALDTTTYGMLQNNKAAFSSLLPLSVSHADGNVVLRWCVTGKKRAKNYFETPMKKADALKLLEQITKALADADEYLIGPQQFLLDVDQLYIDGAAGTPCLICMPTKKAYDRPFACADFIRALVGMIRLEDGDDLPLYKFLYTHPDFTLAEFRASLGELRVKVVDAHAGIVKKLVREEPKTGPAVDPTPIRREVKAEDTAEKRAERITPDPEPEPKKKGGFLSGLFGAKKDKAAEPAEDAPANDIDSILKRIESDGEPSGAVRNTPARESVRNTPEKHDGLSGFTPPAEKPQPARPMGTVIGDLPEDSAHGAFLVSLTDGTRLPITKDRSVVSRIPAIGDIVIADDHISSEHALILVKDGQYFVRDTDSKNHTFKNGSVIRPGDDVPLADGDEVRFWRLSYRFELI